MRFYVLYDTGEEAPSAEELQKIKAIVEKATKSVVYLISDNPTLRERAKNVGFRYAISKINGAIEVLGD